MTRNMAGSILAAIAALAIVALLGFLALVMER